MSATLLARRPTRHGTDVEAALCRTPQAWRGATRVSSSPKRSHRSSLGRASLKSAPRRLQRPPWQISTI